jgi:ABC-type uncharacterized transport system auxiliary subunit
MKNIWGLVFIFLFLMNCGKPPQTFHYSLSLGDPDSLDIHSSIEAIRIVPLEGEAPYKQNHLIYRLDSFEYRFDPYRFWIAPPVDHLREHLIKYLRQSGLFKWVDGSLSHFDNRLSLEITVLAFEESYTPQGRQAKVAIWVQIMDAEANPVWTGEIQNIVPITESGAAGVVKAMNDATRNVFEKLLSKLKSL